MGAKTPLRLACVGRRRFPAQKAKYQFVKNLGRFPHGVMTYALDDPELAMRHAVVKFVRQLNRQKTVLIAPDYQRRSGDQFQLRAQVASEQVSRCLPERHWTGSDRIAQENRRKERRKSREPPDQPRRIELRTLLWKESRRIHQDELCHQLRVLRS